MCYPVGIAMITKNINNFSVFLRKPNRTIRSNICKINLGLVYQCNISMPYLYNVVL